MSPHALTPPAIESGRYSHIFPDSEIIGNGFLPSQLPLSSLPNPYFRPWESLVQNLPEFIRDNTLRQRVLELPVLSTSRLKTVPEWRRAYSILTFIAHGFIWSGEHAAEVLPPPIAVPLLQVSAHLGLPPVATYASLCLWNFRSLDSDFTSLDSLHALQTLTGTEDESWFYMVSVAMEAQGAYIIPVMLSALEAIKRRDYTTITRSLEELTSCIRKIHSLLGRMYEKCNPMVFYYEIRPFLAGSKNMSAAGLPRGVFYDEGNGHGQWLQLRGGSNGQSSLIQFLDIVLGVEHTSSGNASPDGKKTPDQPGFHQEVRSHMPPAHRQFLEGVARMGSIRNLANLPGAAPKQERLRAAFKAATAALTEFRNKHLEIVTRYIIIPARRPPPQRNSFRIGLSGTSICASTGSQDTGELTGTGGTALLPFLKQVRDETCQAGCVGTRG